MNNFRRLSSVTSVLRSRPEQLRSCRDVLVLRPLSHPSYAALPLVEEAHHTVTAGGFNLFSSQV